jgi:hypothetical protein
MEHKWIGRIDENLSKMQRMEARLGVSEASPPTVSELVGQAYAARRCAFCSESETCENWLDAGASGDAWFDFCPNANYFNLKRGAA